MNEFLTVMGCIMAYMTFGGFTMFVSRIALGDYWEESLSFFAGLLWPIAMPMIVGYKSCVALSRKFGGSTDD